MSRWWLLSGLLGLLAPAAVPARAEEPADAVKAIRAVRDEFYAAVVRRDAEAVGRLLSDDYVMVGMDGGEATRDDRLKSLMRNNIHLQSISFPDSAVRVYGDMAVEISQANRMGDLNGNGIRAITRNTMIYHKTADGWLICGEHISPANAR